MATAGVGTSLKRSADDSSASTYTAISEVNSISGPNMSREMIDTTSLDTSGGYRTFIPSFRDGGEVTLACNFDRDNYITFLTDFQSSSITYWQIVFPDTGATTFEFAAYVSALGQSTPNDDKLTMDVTLKISGEMEVSS